MEQEKWDEKEAKKMIKIEIEERIRRRREE